MLLTWIGEKISPIEVDAVLLSHPDITQAVCFGIPDDKYGEEVMGIKKILSLLQSSIVLFAGFIGFIMYLMPAASVIYGYKVVYVAPIVILYI